MTAMRKVPRHEFVPIELQPYAYDNIPLPIGFAKTISQPFVVALMTDLLDVKADDSVLEIGTGLVYQTAILAQLARRVYSVEIIEELGQAAKQRLRQQGLMPALRRACPKRNSKNRSLFPPTSPPLRLMAAIIGFAHASSARSSMIFCIRAASSPENTSNAIGWRVLMDLDPESGAKRRPQAT
jgi:hypothetical protein